jgi:hypothetical protein
MISTSARSDYFAGDRDLASLKDFIYSDLHGTVVVHDRYPDYGAPGGGERDPLAGDPVLPVRRRVEVAAQEQGNLPGVGLEAGVARARGDGEQHLVLGREPVQRLGAVGQLPLRRGHEQSGLRGVGQADQADGQSKMPTLSSAGRPLSSS